MMHVYVIPKLIISMKTQPAFQVELRYASNTSLYYQSSSHQMHLFTIYHMNCGIFGHHYHYYNRF